MLSTFRREHKPTVGAMETWANKEVENTRLVDTLQRVVVDALFSIGVAKVALATPADSASVAWTLGAGQPFAMRVDLDDWVFDVHARDLNEVGFMGHRYRVPLDAVKDSKLYSRLRKRLTPSTDSPYNADGGDERVSLIGRGLYAQDQEFEDYVDLWEIYLPRHRLVYTLADDQVAGASDMGGAGPLRVQNWLGPDAGPYRTLGFGTVPGNPMPKAPVQDLIDLHLADNRAFRKMINGVDRIKELLLVPGVAMSDAERVVPAVDGQVLKCENPERLKQVVMGGTGLQAIMLAASTMSELFSRQAGNLDIMGGLSPQAKTATQDKMLNENSSAGVSDMQDRTVEFTSNVMKSLCWYWHHDPLGVQRSAHSLPGLPGVSLTRQVGPGQRRKVPFEELEVKVDPYSMRHQTPKERMAMLDQVMTQVFVPLAPQLAQAGIVPDWNAYLKLKSVLMDTPELADILTIQPPPDPESGGDRPPGMPAQTERTYNRVSTPGRTDKGNDQNLRSALMGVNPGGAPETAGLNGVHK